MDRYKFKNLVFRDRAILWFFLFVSVNFLSYATGILLGTTLVPLRIGLLVVLLVVLIKDKLRYETFDKISNKYIFLFLFFYSCSFILNLAFSDLQFFFSLFISVMVFSLFINYLDRHYRNYSDRILLDIIFYPLLFFPFILILNPGYISLDLYGSQNIEALGLKSRFLGWSCAVLLGILLYKIKQSRTRWWEKGFMIVLFFFIIISGSRSSLLSACLIIIFYFFRQKNKVRYFIIGAASILFIVLLLGNRILNYSQQVSFQKRQEAQEMGISDETYRKEVLIDAMNMSWENIGHFVFGFGAGDFKKALSRYYAKYRHNELSSHNTYLEVFITGGLLTFIAFFFLYVIFPLKNFYAKNREMLYVFIPLILIATTEDNFGLGQFLFVVFSLFSFYSFKI